MWYLFHLEQIDINKWKEAWGWKKVVLLAIEFWLQGLFLQRLYSQNKEGGNINTDSEVENVTLHGLYAGCGFTGDGDKEGVVDTVLLLR